MAYIFVYAPPLASSWAWVPSSAICPSRKRIIRSQNWVELTDETAVKNLQRTLDLLEDDDDVQYVYHNWAE